MITRRKVNLGIASAAVVASTRSFAQAQPIELKISHYNPPNHTAQKQLLAWGEQLEKLSKGRLKATVYPSGQLGGGANRQFDSCRNGIVDIALSIHGATPGRYSTTELVTLPYVSPKAGDSCAIASRRLSELAPTYLADEHQGLKILWMSTIPPLKFHSRVPLRTIADFKGIKIRYAGVQYKNMIDALGAVPLPVPPPETQDALAKGIVDAAIFAYEGAASFGLESVVKYSLEPGVSSLTWGIVMNPAKYNSLPDDLKAIINETTTPAFAESFGKAFDEAELAGKQKLVSSGVQVNVMAPDEVDRMKKLLTPQIEAAVLEVDKQGRPGRKFYEAYVK